MKESDNHLYKLCPKCSYFCNKFEDVNFCPTCGEKLFEMCKKCDKAILYPYAKYCGFCGHPYKEVKDEIHKEF